MRRPAWGVFLLRWERKFDHPRKGNNILFMIFFPSFWQVHSVIFHFPPQRPCWHVAILGFYRRPVNSMNHNINNIIHISHVATFDSLRLNCAICLQTPSFTTWFFLPLYLQTTWELMWSELLARWLLRLKMLGGCCSMWTTEGQYTNRKDEGAVPVGWNASLCETVM